MSELYSRTDEELEQGLREVEIVGVGFGIPTYVGSKCSEIFGEPKVEVAA